MSEVKTCVMCDTTYERGPRIDDHMWSRQRFCGTSCKNKEYRDRQRANGIRHQRAQEARDEKVQRNRRTLDAYLEYMRRSARTQRQRREMRRQRVMEAV